jgi:hypothetical protein
LSIYNVQAGLRAQLGTSESANAKLHQWMKAVPSDSAQSQICDFWKLPKTALGW